jgi:hypothetical protein
MDALDVITHTVLRWLPTVTDAVVYGALSSVAAALYAIGFFGIVGSFYRSTVQLHSV